ncbi:GntR family transcriptional regulator [Oricola sp.]|uniref:GntR family transcriptional regulator n=1 Tax=Oricola sp. TaxID=1979950 RepID=UPI0025F81757|nr:GntR family transcriptional regulator [Oricola sp.]MCI5076001.1 GntR family transcriptional regulator [Oricola sp.]
MPRLSSESERFDPGPALDDIEIDRSRSIAPQIYDALRTRIVDNRLPPGAALSESEIARFCDISRTPLRAALQQLSGEGLIIVRPQVGSVVAPHDEGRLRESVFIRCAIEEAVARRLAAVGIDEAVLAPILAAQRLAAERDDYMTFFRHDEQFHEALAEMAGVPNAWHLVQSVKAHVDRRRLKLMSSIKGRSMQAYRDHVALLECIRAHDAEGAAEVIRAHVDSVFETGHRNGEKTG